MSRVSLVLKCALVLLLCAACIGAAHLWKSGPLTLESLGVAMVIPGLATLLFAAISIAFPELYAVASLRFPLNVTLPLIYTALLMLAHVLFSRVGAMDIARQPDWMAPAEIWAVPWVLSITFLAGLLSLSALGALSSDGGRR